MAFVLCVKESFNMTQYTEEEFNELHVMESRIRNIGCECPVCKLAPFEDLVKEGYLRKSENEKLVLYKYNDHCTWKRHWNEYTRQARGLILEKATGKVIARPWSKFFNLNEMPETQFNNLPTDNYSVTEKVDGSLGIIYHYMGKWNVATCGSLNSEQSIVATEMLNNYNLSEINEDLTLLCEIVYPENKIVVDYKGERKLVLLSAIDRTNDYEVSDLAIPIISRSTGIPAVKQFHDYTIEQMIELQKTIPKDEEGFVVRYSNGLRVKIKGAEYMKMHRLLSMITPLAFFEVMKEGKIGDEYMSQFPEEFFKDASAIATRLEAAYGYVSSQILLDYEKLPSKEATREGRKAVGLFLKEGTLKHPAAMFHLLLDDKEALDSYIMKTIRPDGNVFKALDK